MLKVRKDHIICILLFVGSLVLFTQGLSVHGLEYRDDEIFYVKSTQEMVVDHNVLSPTYFEENRFQKPILYYWFILVSYKLFGINWFGARFVAVFFAGLTVCLTWLMSKELFNRRIALLSAIILMTTPLFFRHAKNAVPDMPLNFFIVLGMYYAVKFIPIPARNNNIGSQDSANQKYSILLFVACALGFMIKGFAAVVIPLSTLILYALFIKKPKILSELKFGRGLLLMVFIISPWFLYMVKTHGHSYLYYMVFDETKSRFLGDSAGNFLIERIKALMVHSLFYLKVLFSYFAPWSIFIFVAVPLAIRKQMTDRSKGNALLFLLTWFFVVFFFFSMMYFVINHYMLVLTTPFAILVSYFLLEVLDDHSWAGKTLNFLRKYVLLFILSIGCLAFTFLYVFLAGGSKWWMLVFLLMYIFIMRFIHKNRKSIVAPLTLGIFMLFVFSQSSLMGKAGVTAHSSLQKFAATINQEISEESIIGVGSHDIHEKEFQVYFDRKVEKAATSEQEETKAKLYQLFATDQRVYCLMTEKDFKNYVNDVHSGPLAVIQEDYIFRKRMNIDGEFFKALIKLDQEKVYHYLMEKLVLVKKDQNV